MSRSLFQHSPILLLTLALAGCANGERKPEKAAVSPSPVVQPAESVPSGSGRGYARVRLGIRPSMAEGGEPGVLVQSVSTGTTAENGGVLAGDLIVAWDGEDLIDIMDMLGRLQSHEPGDEVVLVVIRDDQEVTLHLTMLASDRQEQN